MNINCSSKNELLNFYKNSSNYLKHIEGFCKSAVFILNKTIYFQRKKWHYAYFLKCSSYYNLYECISAKIVLVYWRTLILNLLHNCLLIK